jgi:hypothetical protein
MSLVNSWKFVPTNPFRYLPRLRTRTNSDQQLTQDLYEGSHKQACPFQSVELQNRRSISMAQNIGVEPFSAAPKHYLPRCEIL